jgi:dihydrofolate reductase
LGPNPQQNPTTDEELSDGAEVPHLHVARRLHHRADPRDGVPLGDGGEQLHDWMAGLTDLRRDRRSVTSTPDADEIGAAYDGLGALGMGRAMFDAGYEPWGADPPFGMPVFVVTNGPHDPLPMRGGTTYHFVTEGIEAALEQARAAAGGRDVGVAGGANLAQQYLEPADCWTS